jgi:hypothetical protein
VSLRALEGHRALTGGVDHHELARHR